MNNQKKHTWPVIALGIIQLVAGFSGVIGGRELIADPSGSGLDMPVHWLADTPFSDYLIPGIVLFVLVGLASLIGATITFYKQRHAGLIAVGLGAVLMVWIIVQILMVGYRSYLQPLYFSFGALEFVFGFVVHRWHLDE